MTDTVFTNQVTAMMRELNTLRTTTKAQAGTIGLLKKQYDDLARDHAAMLQDHEKKLHRAYTDRDTAECKLSEVNIILQGTAQYVLEGLRAMKGDEAAPQPSPKPNGVDTAPEAGPQPLQIAAPGMPKNQF